MVPLDSLHPNSGPANTSQVPNQEMHQSVTQASNINTISQVTSGFWLINVLKWNNHRKEFYKSINWKMNLTLLRIKKTTK